MYSHPLTYRRWILEDTHAVTYYECGTLTPLLLLKHGDSKRFVYGRLLDILEIYILTSWYVAFQGDAVALLERTDPNVTLHLTSTTVHYQGLLGRY